MLDAYIALFAVTIVMPIVVSALVLIGKAMSNDQDNGKRPAVMRRVG